MPRFAPKETIWYDDDAWISLLLLLLASAFCMPRFFWKYMESERAEVFEFVNKDWSLCWMFHCKSTSNILEKLNKCTVHHITSSGNVESLEAIIVLPTSVIHEKIYIFLWYWFFMMRVLSCAVLAYRLFLCVLPCFRLKVLQMRCEKSNILDLGLITDVLSIDDWF
ncbi:hypothetical protein CEXT_437901 [Caerostris extrusa]|uniref:Innexin n=1 Tax=Caerostris extrusa TaxID=172846 RepID=A0AAV4YCY6_CAEEX|nr:hypothetical protein CEXT_437901 [Caerostris extrusa]